MFILLLSKRKLIITVGLAVIIVMVFAANVYASNTTTHIHKGGYDRDRAKDLRVYISPTVERDGYRWRVEESLRRMTGQSSNLGFHIQTGRINSNISVDSGAYTNETYWGQASYYCRTAWSGLSPCSRDSSNTRTRTEIRLNTHTMSRDNFSYNNTFHTIIHEVGHALSLGHVQRTDGTRHSVMRQGKLTYTQPQPMDTWHLQHKWGR